MPFMYVEYMTKLMAPKPYPEQPHFDPPKLIPLRKPIEESTIGVLTSCGAQLKEDERMAETNDLSYRLLHRSVPLSKLKVSHMTPSRKWAMEEPQRRLSARSPHRAGSGGRFQEARFRRRFHGRVDHTLYRAAQRRGAPDQERVRPPGG